MLRIKWPWNTPHLFLVHIHWFKASLSLVGSIKIFWNESGSHVHLKSLLPKAQLYSLGSKNEVNKEC